MICLSCGYLVPGAMMSYGSVWRARESFHGHAFVHCPRVRVCCPRVRMCHRTSRRRRRLFRFRRQSDTSEIIIIIIIITIFKHGTISQYIKYLQKRKKKSDLPIGRVLNYYINIKKIYCLSICNCFILLLKVDKPFCDFNSIGRLFQVSAPL